MTADPWEVNNVLEKLYTVFTLSVLTILYIPSFDFRRKKEVFSFDFFV